MTRILRSGYVSFAKKFQRNQKGSEIFYGGAILYSDWIGVDYLATFWNNPFNIMFLGLGVPMVLIGIGMDISDKLIKFWKNKSLLEL